jgi:hypothetical protein
MQHERSGVGWLLRRETGCAYDDERESAEAAIGSEHEKSIPKDDGLLT